MISGTRGYPVGAAARFLWFEPRLGRATCVDFPLATRTGSGTRPHTLLSAASRLCVVNPTSRAFVRARAVTLAPHYVSARASLDSKIPTGFSAPSHSFMATLSTQQAVEPHRAPTPRGALPQVPARSLAAPKGCHLHARLMYPIVNCCLHFLRIRLASGRERGMALALRTLVVLRLPLPSALASSMFVPLLGLFTTPGKNKCSRGAFEKHLRQGNGRFISKPFLPVPL